MHLSVISLAFFLPMRGVDADILVYYPMAISTANMADEEPRRYNYHSHNTSQYVLPL